MLCRPPKLWDLSGTRGLSMCAVKGENSGAGVKAVKVRPVGRPPWWPVTRLAEWWALRPGALASACT